MNPEKSFFIVCLFITVNYYDLIIEIRRISISEFLTRKKFFRIKHLQLLHSTSFINFSTFFSETALDHSPFSLKKDPIIKPSA